MPKKPDWQLKDQGESSNTGAVRFDCVYLTDRYLESGGGYELLRFWPDGQLMFKGVPTEEAAQSREWVDTYYRGTVGYFQVQDDALLTETFVPINCGQYGRGVGVLKENGEIWMVRHGPRRGPLYDYDPPKKYRPLELEFDMHLKPDW